MREYALGMDLLAQRRDQQLACHWRGHCCAVDRQRFLTDRRFWSWLAGISGGWQVIRQARGERPMTARLRKQ